MYRLFILAVIIGCSANPNALQCASNYILKNLGSNDFPMSGKPAYCATTITSCACINGTFKGNSFFAFDCPNTAATIITNVLQGPLHNYTGEIAISCDVSV